MLRLAFAILACLFMYSIQAATFTFNGTIDTNWETPGNWDTYPGSTINAGDEVIINAECEVSTFTILTNNGLLTLNGDLYILSTNLINTGTINNQANFYADGYVTNSGTINNTVDLHILSDSFINNPSGKVYNIAGATLYIDIITNEGLIENDGSASTTRTLSNIGMLINRGGFTFEVTNLENSGMLDNTGTILTKGGYINNNGNIINTGSIDLSDTSFNLYGDFTNSTLINNTGDITGIGALDNTASGIVIHASTGTIYAEMFQNSNLLQNDGYIDILGGYTTNNSGRIEGIGTIFITPSGLNSTGTIAPGNSAGSLNMHVDVLSFAPSSVLEIEIGGTTPGTEYDFVDTYSDAIRILDGTLNVTSIGGFVPAVGDCFTIITETTRFAPAPITGTFATENLFALPTDRQWMVNYNANNVTLCVEAAVPVELGSFEAKVDDQAVILNWETFSELNNKGFEIQHSADGKQFETLDFVQGQGTSLERHHYQYTDASPNTSTNYYRLKQIDFDGAFEYSPIVVVQLNQQKNIKLYPTLVMQGESIQLHAPIGYSYKITDYLGRMLANGMQAATITNLPTAHLPKGNYVLYTTDKTTVSTQLFSIQ